MNQKPDIETVSVTADNGDIYEATRGPHNESWAISYPEGGDRYDGTEAEVRAHMRRLIKHGVSAKIQATS